jgi:hypothetical protein
LKKQIGGAKVLWEERERQFFETVLAKSWLRENAAKSLLRLISAGHVGIDREFSPDTKSTITADVSPAVILCVLFIQTMSL